jgi:hypothetical protein
MRSLLRSFGLIVPLQGCLFYSLTDEPKPGYYGVIAAAEVGLAVGGGAMAAYGDDPSRPADEAPPSLFLTSAGLLASFIAIDLIMFGIAKAQD